MMEQSEIVKQYVARINRGEITFDRVRQELTAQRMSEDEIKSIVRGVDEALQQELVRGGTQSMRDNLFRIGLVLTVAGLLLTVATLAGFIEPDGFGTFIAYGPLLIGISMIIAAKRSGRKRPKP
jgi:hypothetical protein